MENVKISNRVGTFAKHKEKFDITKPDLRAPCYVNESTRFDKDFAVYEYDRREAERLKKQEKFDLLRRVFVDREKDRWRSMANEIIKSEDKFKKSIEISGFGRKNHKG